MKVYVMESFRDASDETQCLENGHDADYFMELDFHCFNPSHCVLCIAIYSYLSACSTAQNTTKCQL